MSSQTANDQLVTTQTGDFNHEAARRLELWMTQEISDHEGPITIERLPGGQSNPTFRLASARRNYVLRRKPPGALLRSAHAIEREFEVMTALGPTGFPVPRTFGLCLDPSVIGSAFYLMEMVEGLILWDPKLPGMSPAERRAIYNDQIDTLAALHRIDVSKVGLSDFGKAGNYFSRQLFRWSKQYRASEPPHDRNMEQLIAWLSETLPPETAQGIVHGDYRIDNMILKPDLPQIAAVLDWELSTLGDPVADLTYYLMMWRAPPGERIAMNTVDFRASGIPTMNEALDRYLAISGRVLDRPVEWYIAFNLFRLAAILQGVAARAARGQANNERALLAQDRVGPLASAAWESALLAGAKE